jgi:hypothetical protein
MGTRCHAAYDGIGRIRQCVSVVIFAHDDLRIMTLLVWASPAPAELASTRSMRRVVNPLGLAMLIVLYGFMVKVDVAMV